MKNGKKINQLWKSEISVLFWRSGARFRDHASPPGASSTRQTRRSRTLVDPVSLFWFVGRTVVGPTLRMSTCWHGRRKLKPECTDRINNRELGRGDICKRGGRSYSSPGPPHPTSATVDAWPPTRMIGTVVDSRRHLEIKGQGRTLKTLKSSISKTVRYREKVSKTNLMSNVSKTLRDIKKSVNRS